MPSGVPANSWPPPFGGRTWVMGVINATPDSFSHDGLLRTGQDAGRLADEMLAVGADLLDIGGESTRPGFRPVTLEEELRRVLPALAAISPTGVAISIDTTKPEVAREALAAGASIVNDVSGLRDPKMVENVAASGAGVVLVHNGAVSKGEDLIATIQEDLARQCEIAIRGGVERSRILVDPGLGMGKGWLANLEIVRRLREITEVGFPLLVGPSRKGMIGRVLAGDVRDRLEGTLALVSMCVAGGADVVRVHDVGPVTRAIRMMDALARPGYSL